MNRVIIAGTLTGEPQQVTTKTGRFRYWFSLKVNDGNGGNPEIMEVVGMSECVKVLKQAALRGQQVLVYGAIHTCEGTDPEVPGKHRFVRADDIAPFKTAVTTKMNPVALHIVGANELGEDKNKATRKPDRENKHGPERSAGHF